MLSKSQARTFFLGGTGFFAIIFIALTIDSMMQVPALSHEENMTPSVIRGKQVWENNNCMGCHTLLGEGAYYAPELTKVYERRGEPWMRIFLKDPEAMFPGQRKMVQYNFSEDQLTDVIAFLKWIGEIDTHGFPPKPDIVMSSAPPPAAAAVSGSSPAAVATRLLVDAARLIAAGLAPRLSCEVGIVEALTDDRDVAEALKNLVALAF